MHLKNETEVLDALYNTVSSFYASRGRKFLIFDNGFLNVFEEGCFVRILLDRKHVIEYKMQRDREIFVSVVSIAIGPHYFTPGDFWDYENSQRFSLEFSPEAIVRNLNLLDEFLNTDP